MAWSVDNAAQGSYNSSNPDTVSITIASTAKLLVVTRWTNGNTAPTGGAPTAGGQTMSDSGQGYIVDTECGVQIWYLVNPPTGTNISISVPNTNTTFGMVNAYSFIPSAGGCEYDNSNSATGTTQNPSLSLSVGHDNCLIVAGLGSGDRDVPSAGTNYTLLSTPYDAGNQTWGDERWLDSGTSGSKTVSFGTVRSDDWGLIGISFNETAATQTGSAAISGAGTLSATGIKITSTTAPISGTGSIANTPAIAIAYSSATISGTGTLTAIGAIVKFSSAAISGTGTLTASGDRYVTGSAAISGTGSIANVPAIAIAFGVSPLSGTGTITDVPAIAISSSTASISGTGTLTATGASVISGDAAISGTGTITGTGIGIAIATAAIAGTGTLTSDSIAITTTSAAISGTGSLTADGTVLGGTQSGSAVISGTGTMTPAGYPFPFSYDFTGSDRAAWEATKFDTSVL